VACPYVADDVTIPQSIFHSRHETWPNRKPETPWLIEDGTGKKLMESDLRIRTHGLANGLKTKYNIVLLFSRNHVDYPVAIWAVHRLGGAISGANPDSTTNEPLYQLQATPSVLDSYLPPTFESRSTITSRTSGSPPSAQARIDHFFTVIADRICTVLQPAPAPRDHACSPRTLPSQNGVRPAQVLWELGTASVPPLGTPASSNFDTTRGRQAAAHRTDTRHQPTIRLHRRA
ncbi:hypothetical protein BJ912DRAFT_997609, partial [Pholiota molesta]